MKLVFGENYHAWFNLELESLFLFYVIQLQIERHQQFYVYWIVLSFFIISVQMLNAKEYDATMSPVRIGLIGIVCVV